MSKIERSILDHIAIATSAPAELKKVLILLGLADHGTENVESQGVLTHFLRGTATDATAVELLEPTDPAGVIAKYIAKRGPGIHHFCVRVADIAQMSRKLLDNKVKLVYPVAQEGAHGRKVNFIHPSSAGGILIEISQ